MPAGEITSLARTSDGFLWLGMASGITRFDGQRFVQFTTNSLPALGDNRVNTLLVDTAGDLWVATQGGTVARRHGNKFAAAAQSKPLLGQKISSMAVDRSRGVWVLAAAGVARLTTTNFAMVQATNEPVSRIAIECVTDEAGNLWCRSAAYLYFLEHGRWQVLAHDSFFFSSMQAMCAGQDGGLWLGVASEVIKPKSGQIYRLLDGKLEMALSPYPWPNDSLRTSVQAICEDRRGRIWVGTSGCGVYFWSPVKGWQRLASEGVLANAVVTHIFEDAEGLLWITTQRGGLHQVREQAVKILPLPDQRVENLVQTVCATRDGSLWVGTDGGGVLRWRDGDEEFQSVTNGLASRYVRVLFEDSHSNLWAGTRRGLQCWRGTEFKLVSPSSPFDWITFALGEDGKNNLWFAGSGGLVRMQSENEYTVFRRNSGLLSYYLRAITVDKAGKLECAVPKLGLLQKEGARFEVFGKDRWSGADKICSLFADADGALWITTDGAGLFRFKDEQFRQWTMADGLPDNSLAGIIDDEMGNLWISMNSGVFRCAKSQLENYERGKNPPVLCMQLPVKETETAVDNEPWQPQPTRLPDGRLCFANQGRLILFDPTRLSRGSQASLPSVEETFVDGEPRAADADGWLRVKSGARQFEFRYTAPDLAGEGRLRFRYRLDGVNTSWVDADTRRIAYYNYLPPGDYEFRVMAGGEDGVWRESLPCLKLKILPRFWERRSLQIAGAVLLLLAVAGLVRQVERLRTRRKIQAFQTQQALEQERRRIAQDLHDDIGASVSQLMMLGEMANRASATPEVTRQNVARIQEKTRDLARAMDETIWAVNPRNDTLPNLVNYMHSFATEFFDGSPIRFRLDAPMGLPDLPLEVTLRHNIFLAVKEAMSNVAKHSGAKEVWLRVRWDGAILELLIEDDGRGFTLVAGGAEHDGLGNMPARLKQVGGTCVVQSHPGAGCCVRFSVPLAPARKDLSPVSGMEKDTRELHGEDI